MKKTILALALAAGICTSSQADTIFQTVSHTFNNSSPDPTSFYFAKFNSSLGTLNGVNFSIVSSVDSGTFYVQNGTSGSELVKTPKDYLTVVDNQTPGDDPLAANYNGSNITLVTTPATGSAGFTLASSATQTFTLTSKSLIGTGPIDRDLTAFLAAYTGAGLVSFSADISPTVTITGGAATFDMLGVNNTTEMTMTYDYTATSPVPEPSTLVVQLLVGVGVGLFVIRRRRMAAVKA